MEQVSSSLFYFPFISKGEEDEVEIFKAYKPYINKERLDLLKLYLSHEINCELAKKDYLDKSDYFGTYKYEPGKFITDLIKKIKETIEPNSINYFPNFDFKDSYCKNIESDIIHDTIVKILTRHPFIYYKNIYEAIFQYCLIEFDKLYKEIEKNGKITKFYIFRKLKFYIRRSIELNSNFIISKRFIECIKLQYNKKRIDHVIVHYKLRKEKLEKSFECGNLDYDFYQAARNNLEYKQMQVTSYFSFLLYCYKELIYKNPYRTIKLEELINSKDLLPKEINEQKNTNEELVNLVQDPYFHLTGMIKAENIHLLNELKELHKYNLIKGKFIINNYTSYYLRPNRRNDPKILEAQKLIDKSRHFKNKKNYQNIKIAISNMLKTITLLETKKYHPPSSKRNNLNEEIKEILNSVLDIIQPGISEGNLKYAFFVEFRKRAGINDNTKNIYSIISEDSSDNPQSIKLNKDGLIYNLLYGLYDNDESRNEQSLISTLKFDEDNFISFKDKYFYSTNEEGSYTYEYFSDLLKNDYYNSDTGEGLKMINNSNMCLAFRLSKLHTPDQINNNYRLDGQAVLLITNTSKCNTSNYLNFMSNEKIRLLLLIKEELLEYLQKQFDNDAFIEVLENRKELELKSSMEHMVSNFFGAIEYILGKSAPLTKEDIVMLNFLQRIIHRHFQSESHDGFGIVDIGYKIPYTKKDLESLFNIIFEIPCISRRIIPSSERKLNLEIEDFECHPIIIEQIIPELIINMIRYSIDTIKETKDFNIRITKQHMIFENYFNPELNPKPTFLKAKGGKKMCFDILSKLELQMSETIENDKYSLEIELESK